MYLTLIGRLFLVIGGLNYVHAFVKNQNLFSFISHPTVAKVLTIAIGISALRFAFDRDYFLPFLGHAVIPLNIGSKPTTGILTKVKIRDLPPNVRVVYWGAQESNKPFDNPEDAYGNYNNSGMTLSDKNGEAFAEIICPAMYSVSKFGFLKKNLRKHIHYRYELPKYKGMLSRVYTINVDDICK